MAGLSRATGLAWAAVAAASLWLKSGFPSYAMASAALDDALFVKQARALLGGQWLGPFDQTTLAKGVFFPLFAAVAHWLALPLPVAEQAAWLGAAALAARLLGRLSGAPWLALTSFAVLAFDPVVWDQSFARVLRDGLYMTLSLLTFTLAAGLAAPQAASRRAAGGPGIAFGLALAAFWLTREEGLWLLPALAVALLPALAGLRQRVLRVPLAVALGTAAVVFAGGLASVAALNWRSYGVFRVNEVAAAPFRHAYGALSRIEHDTWRPYVVFPKDARARAYRVSPAARELAGYLDGPAGASWLPAGCAALPGADCSEILSGWFMWALREAVAQAGYYATASSADAYYDRLAREIDTACDAGSIPCRLPRATLRPVFQWPDIAAALARMPQVAATMLEFGKPGEYRRIQPALGTGPADGPLPGVADFTDLAGEVATAPQLEWFLRGWAAASAGPPSLALRLGGADASLAAAYAPPAPDAPGRPGWQMRRFAAQVSCPAGPCDLVAEAPGGEAAVLPLDTASPGRSVAGPSAVLTVEAVERRDPAPLTGQRRALQRAAARAIRRGYAAAAPILAGAAAFGLLLGAARRRACAMPAGLLPLGFAAATAIALRLALLAYLDVTSFPAALTRYTSAATPFVLVLIVVGCACGARALRPARRAG